jgi:hypothetical protein
MNGDFPLHLPSVTELEGEAQAMAAGADHV